ncbi:cell division protein SepF [Cellulomonas composti]|uniref:Cell division protein SepF n=1 Tax=Cellulomonas composti TaxID=266130 RepID=A0A511J8B4_9CELL|nr:cell division protein SepF [Cellulomonas composti]GEL94235.1 cell division protein SepF [Cellulomonas composti]
MAGALRKTMLYLGLADENAAQEEYLDEYEGTVAPMEQQPDERDAQVTPLRRVSAVQQQPQASERRRITTINPRSYNDARKIGEAFRDGTPVIMNLTDMDDADAKRLVDFSAGLIFGLHGAIERVTNKVFLLSPAYIDVASEAGAERSGPAGFYNQS